MKKQLTPNYSIHNTTQLYYNKYVNKIVLETETAYMFRGNNHDVITSNIHYVTNTSEQRYNLPRGLNDNDILLAKRLLKILKKEKSSYSVRVEQPLLTFYSNNDKFINKIIAVSNGYIRKQCKPNSVAIADYLLANTNILIVKNYEFKFKLKLKRCDSIKPFMEWASQLPHKIKVVNTTQRGAWCYVADDKTLNMCKLYLGNNIRRIDECVLETEI
jgi:hypothetical protein